MEEGGGVWMLDSMILIILRCRRRPWRRRPACSDNWHQEREGGGGFGRKRMINGFLGFVQFAWQRGV